MKVNLLAKERQLASDFQRHKLASIRVTSCGEILLFTHGKRPVILTALSGQPDLSPPSVLLSFPQELSV